MVFEPEPPEGLETTAVTVNNDPSEAVDVNVVRLCELGPLLVVSLVTKELVGVGVCDGWLLDDVSCDEAFCVLVGVEEVLKLEDELSEENDENEEDGEDEENEGAVDVGVFWVEEAEVVPEEVVMSVDVDEEVAG